MKVAVIGKPGYVHDSYKMNIDYLFRGVGFNTGNLVYMHAVTQHIQDEKEFFGWKVDSEYINNNFDVMVFVGANQLHPDKDMSILAELFESIDIPSFIIGLGVQSSDFHKKITFQKGTLRFIDVIKEKCSHISVRGDFTANVLFDYGANNVMATGCPSNYINFDPNLGKKLNYNFGDKKRNFIAVNNNFREDMYDFLTRLLLLNNTSDLKFIIQEPKLILDFCRYKTKSEFYHQVISKIQNTLMTGYSFDQVEKFAINNFEAFFNVEAWMEYLTRFDLAIGSRMHGNMLALQTGIPTIFLTHDTRLQEMVEIMKLPFISLKELKENCQLYEMCKKINFDAEEYDQNRKKMAVKFCNIYSSHGISINPGLTSLAKQ